MSIVRGNWDTPRKDVLSAFAIAALLHRSVAKGRSHIGLTPNAFATQPVLRPFFAYALVRL
jgi:hypothetical protein